MFRASWLLVGGVRGWLWLLLHLGCWLGVGEFVIGRLRFVGGFGTSDDGPAPNSPVLEIPGPSLKLLPSQFESSSFDSGGLGSAKSGNAGLHSLNCRTYSALSFLRESKVYL